MNIFRACSEPIRVNWTGSCFSPLTLKGISHRAIFMLSSSYSQVRWCLLWKRAVYELFPSPPLERFIIPHSFEMGFFKSSQLGVTAPMGSFVPGTGMEQRMGECCWRPHLCYLCHGRGQETKSRDNIQTITEWWEVSAAGWRAVKEGREGAGWMENRSRGEAGARCRMTQGDTGSQPFPLNTP